MAAEKNIDFEIIWKKINSSLTEAEQAQLDQWLLDEDHRNYFDLLIKQSGKSQVSESNVPSMPWKRIKRKSGSKKRKWIYAAAVSLGLIAVTFFVWSIPTDPVEVVSDSQEPILPGSDKAILITSSGESIELNADSDFEGKEESAIVKSDGKSIVYSGETAEQKLKNTLIIPKGGKFTATLSDGTRVWINSDSRLEYPVTFSETSRSVKLEGEAFFEVKHDQKRPFTVITDDQEVTVLGTSFSIASYPEANEVLTTLVEGSVNVQSIRDTKSEKLTPGKQSKLNRKTGALTTEDVDVELFVAWKDGWFIFDNQSLGEILETLSRWYNVDVFFVNADAKEMRFTGEIERHENIEEIISLIEKTNAVKIEIKNRTVIVR